MLSTVLRSDTAINVSIQIINAFVAMRRFLPPEAFAPGGFLTEISLSSIAD